MNTLTLKKNGTLAQNGTIVQNDPLPFLSCQIRLEDGYTLRSFFQMCERYTVLVRLNAFLPDCLQRYQASPKHQCVSDAIDHLLFHKTVEMIGFPGQPRLEIYNTLCGMRGRESLAIKSFHLESLLDMPLQLGVLKHIVFGDKVEVFEFDTVFNLFEFIEGIIWELSFHATPRECAL
jgi:hypothetical protein